MTPRLLAAAVLAALAIAPAMGAQTGAAPSTPAPASPAAEGPVGPSPYDVVRGWHKPFAEHRVRVRRQLRRVRGVAGPHLRRAARRVPPARSPIPPEFAGFAGSIKMNVLTAGRSPGVAQLPLHARSQRAGEGTLDAVGSALRGSDGPGPHRLRISPYDPERRVWVVNETFHQIYVFSNDGQQAAEDARREERARQRRHALRQAAGRRVPARTAASSSPTASTTIA